MFLDLGIMELTLYLVSLIKPNKSFIHSPSCQSTRSEYFAHTDLYTQK
jgi:hypothetical protein